MKTLTITAYNQVLELRENTEIGGNYWATVGTLDWNLSRYDTMSRLWCDSAKCGRDYGYDWIVDLGKHSYRCPSQREWDDIIETLDDQWEPTSETDRLLDLLRVSP